MARGGAHVNCNMLPCAEKCCEASVTWMWPIVLERLEFRGDGVGVGVVP